MNRYKVVEVSNYVGYRAVADVTDDSENRVLSLAEARERRESLRGSPYRSLAWASPPEYIIVDSCWRHNPTPWEDYSQEDLLGDLRMVQECRVDL